jgi:hypothetical protein
VAWPPKVPNSVTAKEIKRIIYIRTTPHPFRVLVELGIFRTACIGFMRRGPRNVEQTGNHGIKSEVRASDTVVV